MKNKEMRRGARALLAGLMLGCPWFAGCTFTLGGEVLGSVPLPGASLALNARVGGALAAGVNAAGAGAVPLGAPLAGRAVPIPGAGVVPGMPPRIAPGMPPVLGGPVPQPRVIDLSQGMPPMGYPPPPYPPQFPGANTIQFGPGNLMLVADGRGGWTQRAIPGGAGTVTVSPTGTRVTLDNGTCVVSDGNGHWSSAAPPAPGTQPSGAGPVASAPDRPSSVPSSDLPGGIENGTPYDQPSPPSSTPARDLPGGIENGTPYDQPSPPSSTPARDLPGGIENGTPYDQPARPSSTPAADLAGGIENGPSFAQGDAGGPGVQGP